LPALSPCDSLNVSFAPYVGPARALILGPARNTMRDVNRTLIEALRQSRKQIVCQVVEMRGSTPRKADCP
jgi:hypothetical protein